MKLTLFFIAKLTTLIAVSFQQSAAGFSNLFGKKQLQRTEDDDDFLSTTRPSAQPHVVVAVFTTKPEFYQQQFRNHSAIFANTWAAERIILNNNNVTPRIPLRFRFFSATTLSQQHDGLALMDAIVNILENSDNPLGHVIGVIIETLPSNEPDAVWTHVVYQVAANSLRLPVAIADSRGQTSSGECEAFLSAMPTQHEIDNGILEIVFAAVKTSSFAIILVDNDTEHMCALSSTVEELLNEATLRDQRATLYRLTSQRFVGDDWERVVKEVAERWRKFVVVSFQPDFERHFIQTALWLGFAGRGYVYLALNFDFHLDALNLHCLLDNQTVISAIRLRRSNYDDDDDDFQTLAMKATMKTFEKALIFPPNVTENNESTGFLQEFFHRNQHEWLMQLLTFTNNGFFAQLQYVLPAGKNDGWILVKPKSFSSHEIEPPLLENGAGNPTKSKQENKNDLCRNHRKLRITTIIEPPFIMRKNKLRQISSKQLPKNSSFSIKSGLRPSSLVESRNKTTYNSGARSGNVTSNASEDFEGFCIDLLELLSHGLGFSYELTLVPDGKYGSFSTETEHWNGMIGELVKGNVDLALAPLTITPLRFSVVDFTQSFMNLGIGLIYYKEDIFYKEDGETRLLGMFSFFRPFNWEVWLLAGGAVIAYSVMHFILCCMSPTERNPTSNNNSNWFDCYYRPPTTSPKPKRLWTLPNSVWLAVGTILQQGCDFFPVAKSTRLLYCTWAIVSLGLCSCYTANLAAFLTNERLETPIRKVTDLLQQNKTKYGTLRGGSTHAFFKNSKIDNFRELFANMHRDNTFVSSQDEGIRQVLTGKGKYVFFMESTKIEYEVARDCRLVQIGSLLDSKGYGIATQKGSPLRGMLSSAILKLQSEGVLLSLKNKWWNELNSPNENVTCPDETTSSEYSQQSAVNRRPAKQLSMEVLGGAFLILLGALAFALVVCIAEFVFYGISKAVEKIDGKKYVNGETLLWAWRYHLERVFAAGTSKVILTQLPTIRGGSTQN